MHACHSVGVSSHVWYASYGSNLSSQRFAFYLQGGSPPGATRTYPGTRDSAHPSAERALRVPGQIFFGWESATWGGGGVAFLDPDASGEVLVRAYRLTAEQFTDVMTQEMHRPVEDSPLLDLSTLSVTSRLRLGPGRYETVVLLAWIDNEPVLTFTCDTGPHRPRINPPSSRYLDMLSTGLRESHGLSAAEVAAYLAPLDGIRDA